jgi:non-specific serine/threonine protein kinase
LAGAAAALRTAAGTPASLAGQEKLDRTLAPARRALSDAAADRAWRSGQALSLAEAAAAAYRVVEAPLAPAGLNEGATGNRQRRAPAAALTAREQEVATLITDGLTNRRIGEVLRITEGTAASHVVHILDKLGFSTRAQIAAWVATHGLSGGP